MRATPGSIERDVTPLGAIVVRVLLAAAAIVVLGGMAYLQTFPPMATVMSQSMEPTIKMGDVVLFKSLRGAPPQVGDVVEIRVPAAERQKHSYPASIIHRVVSLNADGTITSKGDNLENPDPFSVPISSIERKVALDVPMAGRAMSFVFSPFGLLWLGIGLVVFVVMPFYDVQRERSELQQAEVASLAELQAKIDTATSWTIAGNGVVTPHAAHGPPESGPTAGRSRFGAETAVVLPDTDADVKERIDDLVSVVGEYGYHLKSHTEILKSMSAASQDLARVVADLQVTVVARPPEPILVDTPSSATQRFEMVRQDAEQLLEYVHRDF